VPKKKLEEVGTSVRKDMVWKNVVNGSFYMQKNVMRVHKGEFFSKSLKSGATHKALYLPTNVAICHCQLSRF
ncbi:hypothetical protein, partial [uncultured Fibrobacter sp.]|uniref:hypothetical protein n=1 Tax=uncultured Fibrobacter sp. TaxID=261512 RepID=UPI0025E99C73